MNTCTNCKHSVTCNNIKEDYHDCSQWERRDNISLSDYLKEKASQKFMKDFEEQILNRDSISDVFEDICEQSMNDGDWNRKGI